MARKGYRTVNMKEELFENLKNLAQKYGMTNAEVLEQALSCFKEKKENGNKEKVISEEAEKDNEMRTPRLTRPIF